MIRFVFPRPLRFILCSILLIDFQAIAFSRDGPERTPAEGCVPELTRVRYPIAALEKRLSGFVVATFATDARGNIRDLQLSGDQVLSEYVGAILRGINLGARCGSQNISLRFRFRIDENLSSATPLTVKRPSATEYEVISPAREVVIISDPPVIGTRRTLPQRIIHWFSKLTFW
jgi:hypothetical protein